MKKSTVMVFVIDVVTGEEIPLYPIKFIGEHQIIIPEYPQRGFHGHCFNDSHTQKPTIQITQEKPESHKKTDYLLGHVTTHFMKKEGLI